MIVIFVNDSVSLFNNQFNIRTKRIFENRGHHRENVLQVSPRASTQYFFGLASRIFKLSLDRVKGGWYVDTYHLSGYRHKYTPQMLVRTKRNRNGKTCSARLRSLVRAIFVYTCEFSPQTFYGHACYKTATWNSNWIPYTTANIPPPRLYRTNGDFFSLPDATVFLCSIPNVPELANKWICSAVSHEICCWLLSVRISRCSWFLKLCSKNWILRVKIIQRDIICSLIQQNFIQTWKENRLNIKILI